MAMGSYKLGATVRVPLIILDSGIAFTDSVDPKIKEIIRPNNTVESGFPASMHTANEEYGTYYYDYKPDLAGDYIVIICYTVSDQEYTLIENFTVNPASMLIPRAEAR
jgi:hypothetical protein